MIYQGLIISALAIVMLGCAAAGVPKTNNPAEKISYAYQLKNANRPVPAQTLLNEALTIYEKNNDVQGLANTYLAFGNLYKSPSYQNMAVVFKRWNEYKSYVDAAKYFDLASKHYLEIGNTLYAGVAKTGAGDAYYLDGNIEMSCKAYSEAEKYNSSDTDLLSERIRGFKSNVSCQ